MLKARHHERRVRPSSRYRRRLQSSLVIDERGPTCKWPSDVDVIPQCDIAKHAQTFSNDHDQHPKPKLRFRHSCLSQHRCPALLRTRQSCDIVVPPCYLPRATSRCAQSLRAVFIEARDKVMTSILRIKAFESWPVPHVPLMRRPVASYRPLCCNRLRRKLKELFNPQEDHSPATRIAPRLRPEESLQGKVSIELP